MKTKKNKKTRPLDNIVVDGQKYERVSNNSIDVELELELTLLEKLDKLVENGMFVSRGDAIRHIIREKILTEK